MKKYIRALNLNSNKMWKLAEYNVVMALMSQDFIKISNQNLFLNFYIRIYNFDFHKR
jgi:hypothetical protein